MPGIPVSSLPSLHLCSPGEKERQPRLEDPCTLGRHVHVGVDVDMVRLLTLSPPPSFLLEVLQLFIYRTQSSSA